jgi:thiol-disulfide isomerase/thioredoxin
LTRPGRTLAILVCLSFLLLFALGAGAEKEATAEQAPTLENTYMGLSAGPLRRALLVSLPEGMLLRANGVIITEAQVRARLEKEAPDDPVRLLLEKNLPYVVERMATEALLAEEAQVWAQTNLKAPEKETRASLIETYLQSIAAQAQVTAEEAKAFFEGNQDMFGGAKYEEVEEELRGYLLEQKREALIDAHVNSLSERIRVEMNAEWLRAHAPAALDNAVDRARRSGKPSLVDFGAGGCFACDQMAPILDDLQWTYGERCNVLVVSVREEPLLGARYGIRAIPVQVFFDAKGREVYRHLGYLPKAQILTRLAELGVK